MKPSSGSTSHPAGKTSSSTSSGSAAGSGDPSGRPRTEQREPEQTAELGDVCPICKGQGFIVQDLPIGHPDFGRAIPCQHRRAEITSRRQDELTRGSNLSQLKHMTFETFMPDGVGMNDEHRLNLRRAFEKARLYAAHPDGWLVLSGTYGCGKTHLAVAIAHEVLRQGEAVLFVVVPDLLDHLRAAFGPNSETSFDERFETVAAKALPHGPRRNYSRFSITATSPGCPPLSPPTCG